MRAQTASRGVIVGGVAASATAGALVAAGNRAGGAELPFVAIGALLVHGTPGSSAVEQVGAGLLLHVAMMFLWSSAFISTVDRAHYRAIGSALVVGLGQFVLSWAVAWSTGNGLASVLPLGDRVVVALVLIIALLVGIRLAPALPQNA